VKTEDKVHAYIRDENSFAGLFDALSDNLKKKIF
jgi:hypothetical protein